MNKRESLRKLIAILALAALGSLPIYGLAHADYNVMTQGGAACDGQTDDTAAFQAAIEATQNLNGQPNTYETIYVPATGYGCNVEHLNLTNIPYGFRIVGESAAYRGRGSWLNCTEGQGDTCIDTTGSQAWSIENLGIVDQGNGGVTLLMAKSNWQAGNSENITLSGDYIQNTNHSAGSYALYNDGGEVLSVTTTQIYGNIEASSSNPANVASDFTNILKPSSMTMITFDRDSFGDGTFDINTDDGSVSNLQIEDSYVNIAGSPSNVWLTSEGKQSLGYVKFSSIRVEGPPTVFARLSAPYGPIAAELIENTTGAKGALIQH